MARSIVSAYLDSHTLEEIDRQAKLRGKTRTKLIREAVEAAFPVASGVADSPPCSEDDEEIREGAVGGAR